jgi:hypothetical protein
MVLEASTGDGQDFMATKPTFRIELSQAKFS